MKNNKPPKRLLIMYLKDEEVLADFGDWWGGEKLNTSALGKELKGKITEHVARFE